MIQPTWNSWDCVNIRNGTVAAVAAVAAAAQERQTRGGRPNAITATAWAGTISSTKTLSSVAPAKSSPYPHHHRDPPRRAAATQNTVSHTAAAIDSAYERVSMPAHVTRGRMAKISPAVTATVRVDICLPSTTTPAAARPTARALESREANSVAPNTANQPCMSR